VFVGVGVDLVLLVLGVLTSVSFAWVVVLGRGWVGIGMYVYLPPYSITTIAHFPTGCRKDYFFQKNLKKILKIL